MEDSERNAIIGGGAVVVVAVVIGAIAFSGGDDTAGGTCSLASGGVVVMASGLKANRNPGVIAAELVGAYGATKACESAIKKLADEPETPVPLELETDDGTTVEEETTGSELLEPAPAEPTSDLERAIDCIGSSSQFAYELCVDGILPPP